MLKVATAFLELGCRCSCVRRGVRPHPEDVRCAVGRDRQTVPGPVLTEAHDPVVTGTQDGAQHSLCCAFVSVPRKTVRRREQQTAAGKSDEAIELVEERRPQQRRRPERPQHFALVQAAERAWRTFHIATASSTSPASASTTPTNPTANSVFTLASTRSRMSFKPSKSRR